MNENIGNSVRYGDFISFTLKIVLHVIITVHTCINLNCLGVNGFSGINDVSTWNPDLIITHLHKY